MVVYDCLTIMFVVIAFGLSLITSFFAYPEIPTIFLIFGYYFSVYIVAQTIGEDDGWQYSALKFYFGVLVITVVVFSIIYWRYGLVYNGEKVENNFFNSVYFSLTTWTTLGYGDFAPTPRIRHITSIQAILGYAGLGLFIALLSGYINNMATNRKEVNRHNRELIREQSEAGEAENS